MANAMVAASPGGIEAQEAAAQREFQREQKLPREGTTESGTRYNINEKTNQAQMESLGFVFGADIDELFVACQLPQGWEIKPTEHSMWSLVWDAQGRERMRIFYKGAFYDRRADLRVNRRYKIEEWYAASPAEPSEYKSGTTQEEWLAEQRCMTVQDYNGAVLYHTGTYTNAEDSARNAAYNTCKDWLTALYPLWEDFFAYWDETQAEAAD